MLDHAGIRGESYEKTLRRILTGQADIWAEILAVDGEAPEKHKVLFQLGNEPPRYYFYAQGRYSQVQKPTVTPAEEEAAAERAAQ